MFKNKEIEQKYSKLALEKLKEHLKELEKELFQEIKIRRKAFVKLVKIANLTGMSPEQALESIVSELYSYLKEEGDI
jgi:predicted mannosyl-3-phosphoglycerate phosphatase (HAD superfamily)